VAASGGLGGTGRESWLTPTPYDKARQGTTDGGINELWWIKSCDSGATRRVLGKAPSPLRFAGALQSLRGAISGVVSLGSHIPFHTPLRDLYSMGVNVEGN